MVSGKGARRIPWKHSEETKRKISESHKGKVFSDEHKKNLSEYWKGRPRPWLRKPKSKSWRKALSKSLMGHSVSNEARKKMSLANKENPRRYWLGKNHSFETRQKIAKALQGKKSNLWAGGLSRVPYTNDFNNILKEQIRHSWGNICILCGEKENGRKLDVHHINYEKHDNRPENLIPMHALCHLMTNQNRDFWIEYFEGCNG